MNTTITTTITPEERIDLQRLRDRLLKESKDRVRETMLYRDGSTITYAKAFTETSHEAERILPVIERLLSHPTPAPDQITTGGIVQPTPLRTGFKTGDTVTWVSQSSGYKKTKVGIIVAIVRPHTEADACCPFPYSLRSIAGRPRDHESYLVSVNGSSRLYWPRVSQLMAS